jgi:hypothetical protein
MSSALTTLEEGSDLEAFYRPVPGSLEAAGLLCPVSPITGAKPTSEAFYEDNAGIVAQLCEMQTMMLAAEEQPYFYQICPPEKGRLFFSGYISHCLPPSQYTWFLLQESAPRQPLVQGLAEQSTLAAVPGPTCTHNSPGILLEAAWPRHASERLRNRAAWSVAWQAASQTLTELTQLTANWDGRGAIPVDSATAHAAEVLLSPFRSEVPAPHFMPGPNGDVWAIWGEHDLSIEICFRSPDDVFVMIDDILREIQDFEDVDPGLAMTTRALERLRQRANAGD